MSIQKGARMRSASQVRVDGGTNAEIDGFSRQRMMKKAAVVKYAVSLAKKLNDEIDRGGLIILKDESGKETNLNNEITLRGTPS